MSSPVSSVVTRFAYGISQLPRVAWYLGLGLALRRLSEAARQREGSQSRAPRRPPIDAPVPDRDYISIGATWRGCPMPNSSSNYLTRPRN